LLKSPESALPPCLLKNLQRGSFGAALRCEVQDAPIEGGEFAPMVDREWQQVGIGYLFVPEYTRAELFNCLVSSNVS
jgi:hypothetical protein